MSLRGCFRVSCSTSGFVLWPAAVISNLLHFRVYLMYIITHFGLYVVSYHNRYENDARVRRVLYSVYVPPASREPRRGQHAYERLYIYTEHRYLFGFRTLK